MIMSRPSASSIFKNQTICSRMIGFLKFRETGSAMVEMALVLPVILCLLTGIFSVSMALYQKLQLAEAMSSAGRVLAADRGATDPCADTVTALDAASPGLASSSVGIKITIDGNTYGTNASTVSCTAAGGNNNPLMPAGSTAVIQTTYPCSLSIYAIKGLGCSIGEQIGEVVQ
jgi:Flp pilus assembly protein TadG